MRLFLQHAVHRTDHTAFRSPQRKTRAAYLIEWRLGGLDWSGLGECGASGMVSVGRMIIGGGSSVVVMEMAKE